MFFLMHGILILFYIAAIIYTCEFFTNAIEHLGSKLKLGNSATGSILAVVGTSLPETVVPLVAIFGAILFKADISTGQDVALGAMIGSPFMLNTFALFILGCSVFVFHIFKKREKTDLNPDYRIVLRDCKYFLLAYVPAILASFLCSNILKMFVVLYLVVVYCFFVFRTIIKSKKNFIETELEDLIISKIMPFFQKTSLSLILLQIILSLFGLIIFSHFFVGEIEILSKAMNINPLILSLIITPFATELPECVNSIIWAKSLKDELAISNILGGTIFQATITFSIGILLTDWKLNFGLLINAALVVLSVVLFVFGLLKNKKITLFSLLLCGLFYLIYLIYLAV